MRLEFQTRAEVDAYLAHEKIECLECGQRFAFLGNHLRRVHGISADEYRIAWGLPATVPLAGTAYRAAHAEKIRRMQAEGALTYDHLPRATEAARSAPRPRKTPMDAERQAAMLSELRRAAGRRSLDGNIGSDGRDAKRHIEYARAWARYRAGDAQAMAEFWKEWDSKSLGQVPRGHIVKPEEIVRIRTQCELSEADAARLVRATLREYRSWESGEARMHPGLLELLRIKGGARRGQAKPTAFSPSEDKILADNAHMGVSWIARALGRTTPAVHKRAMVLGIEITSQVRKFTAEEDQFILDHRDQTAAWIGEKIGRAAQAVDWRAERILKVALPRPTNKGGRKKKSERAEDGSVDDAGEPNA